MQVALTTRTFPGWTGPLISISVPSSLLRPPQTKSTTVTQSQKQLHTSRCSFHNQYAFRIMRPHRGCIIML
ncbi:hypothetical protein I7I50_03989 [Histoplasma capsulatum G186AR]|uniref:Uncharacterized protein n=1 Tax=Ajellomyces capsulatus TaxID=5037 RepID=A0A8H7YLZ5_AJECA|nr:hypothetical protein I7I52_04897 [Histoplasma capsulatum]QSS74997.1 hypothetical protein I7I50_03989 [Histoplasma capsulatum G186AR]